MDLFDKLGVDVPPIGVSIEDPALVKQLKREWEKVQGLLANKAAQASENIGALTKALKQFPKR
jgi:hypothetical protein